MELVKENLKGIKKLDWNTIRDNLENHILIPITSFEFLSTEFQKKIIIFLLENGADINFKDENGETALHIAIENENKEIFQLLLEKGADPNIYDKDGFSPFHNIKGVDTEMLNFLLEKGEDPNYQDKVELINFLIEKGTKFNPTDTKENLEKWFKKLKTYYKMHLENWYTLINEKKISPELDFHFNKNLEKSLLDKAKKINENFNKNLKFPFFNKKELEKSYLFFDVLWSNKIYNKGWIFIKN